MKRRVLSISILILLSISDYSSSSKLYDYYDSIVDINTKKAVYCIPIISMLYDLFSIYDLNKYFISEYDKGNLVEYNNKIQETAYSRLNIGYGIKCRLHYLYIQKYNVYSNIVTYGTQDEVNTYNEYHFIFVYPIVIYMIVRLCIYVIIVSCIIKPRRKRFRYE